MTELLPKLLPIAALTLPVVAYQVVQLLASHVVSGAKPKPVGPTRTPSLGQENPTPVKVRESTRVQREIQEENLGGRRTEEETPREIAGSPVVGKETRGKEARAVIRRPSPVERPGTYLIAVGRSPTAHTPALRALRAHVGEARGPAGRATGRPLKGRESGLCVGEYSTGVPPILPVLATLAAITGLLLCRRGCSL
ncbi:hypothetical protein [Methanopyrus sp.]